MISKIGPKSLRSEGPLIEAHNPYECKLSKKYMKSLSSTDARIYGAYAGQIRRESKLGAKMSRVLDDGFRGIGDET